MKEPLGGKVGWVGLARSWPWIANGLGPFAYGLRAFGTISGWKLEPGQDFIAKLLGGGAHDSDGICLFFQAQCRNPA